MAKKQTRSNISVSAAAYARIQAHCAALGIPVSRFIEGLINTSLDADPSPVAAARTDGTITEIARSAASSSMRAAAERAEPCEECGELGHTYRKHRINGMDRPAYDAPEAGDTTPLRKQLDRAIQKHGIPPMADGDSVPMSRGPGETTAARAYGADSVNLNARRPGEQLHRIAQRTGAKAVDRDEAHRKVAQKPWASTARYLGVSRGFHVFAYRDTETT